MRQERPHLLVLIVDTLRADRLGCYGDSSAASPEIDALAESGTFFTRAVAPSSWTRPSIATMLTSQYPRSLGIYVEQRHVLDDRFTTLPEILQGHGYTTIGLTANPNINSSFGFDQGFDTYVDSDAIFGFMPAEPGKVLAKETKLFSARELFDQALEQIDSATGPIYLQVDLMEAHEYLYEWSTLTREEFRGLYLNRSDFAYMQAIRQASFEIGSLWDALASRPGWSDAICMLVSDHGEGLADHPGVRNSAGHGTLLYESNVRIPWIVWNGVGARGRIDRPVRLLDFAPTILDLVDIDVPREMVGISLAPLLRGESVETLPDYFITETRFRGADKRAVFSTEWNLFDHADEQQGLDILELQPAGTKENGRQSNALQRAPEIARKMSAYLADWQERFPMKQPTLQEHGLNDRQIEQLRSIGYMQ